MRVMARQNFAGTQDGRSSGRHQARRGARCYRGAPPGLRRKALDEAAGVCERLPLRRSHRHSKLGDFLFKLKFTQVTEAYKEEWKSLTTSVFSWNTISNSNPYTLNTKICFLTLKAEARSAAQQGHTFQEICSLTLKTSRNMKQHSKATHISTGATTLKSI
ncbi:hypothetical protein O3P69_000053 [Scylla paramamosain]|uniref:Uncharacterized protein n=1 Tax=Scylla paramamosain TaxID=85552 RepID=A0AAW0UYD2_SCYPA